MGRRLEEGGERKMGRGWLGTHGGRGVGIGGSRGGKCWPYRLATKMRSEFIERPCCRK